MPNNIDPYIEGLDLNQDVYIYIAPHFSKPTDQRKLKQGDKDWHIRVSLKCIYGIGQEKEGYVENKYAHPKKRIYNKLLYSKTEGSVVKQQEKFVEFMDDFFKRNKELRVKRTTINGYLLHIFKKFDKEYGLYLREGKNG